MADPTLTISSDSVCFIIVKAPDLDAALEWGRKVAKVIALPIEVRPFQGEVDR